MCSLYKQFLCNTTIIQCNTMNTNFSLPSLFYSIAALLVSCYFLSIFSVSKHEIIAFLHVSDFMLTMGHISQATDKSPDFSSISDPTDQFLVTFHNQIFIIKLDRSNYMILKKQMLHILKSYDLDEFVLEKKKCPQKFLDAWKLNPSYKFWIRQDQMIGSWLIVSMTDELIKEVSDFDT